MNRLFKIRVLIYAAVITGIIILGSIVHGQENPPAAGVPAVTQKEKKVVPSAAESLKPGQKDEAPKETGKSPTLIGLARKGGPVLIIIGLCSVLTVTFVIEKIVYFRGVGSEKKIDILSLKIAGSSDIDEGIKLCNDSKGVGPRVFKVALESIRQKENRTKVEARIEAQVVEEMMGMERFLPELDSMVTMTPLLGLLGTVIGMIRSFAVVASSGMGKPELLAEGISEALVNTASGLLVAVPALFFFNFFNSRKERIVMNVEKGVTRLLSELMTEEGTAIK